MKKKKIFKILLTLLLIAGCSRSSITLTKPKLNNSESLSYIVNSKNTITTRYNNRDEVVVVTCNYKLVYENVGHIKYKISFNDLIIERDNKKEQVDIEQLFKDNKIMQFYDNSQKCFVIDFYDLDKGVIDDEHINRVLSKTFTNNVALDNIDNFISTSTLNSTEDIVLKKGYKFSTSSKNSSDASQEIDWVVKNIDKNYCYIRGRGISTFPKLLDSDHNLEGTILISEKRDITTGQMIESTTKSTTHGYIMNEDLDEPVKLKMINEIYQLRI